MEGEIAALQHVLRALENGTVESLQILTALIDEEVFNAAIFVCVCFLNKSDYYHLPEFRSRDHFYGRGAFWTSLLETFLLTKTAWRSEERDGSHFLQRRGNSIHPLSDRSLPIPHTSTGYRRGGSCSWSRAWFRSASLAERSTAWG